MFSSTSSSKKRSKGGCAARHRGLNCGIIYVTRGDSYENLEAGRVARQLEETQDADDGEELEDVGVLQVRGELLQGQIDEEGERRDVVDDVDRGAHEQELVRTGDEAHQDLDREPRVADGLDVEEGLVGVRLRLVQRPRR